jgi:hypothetical protein
MEKLYSHTKQEAEQRFNKIGITEIGLAPFIQRKIRTNRESLDKELLLKEYYSNQNLSQ